MATIEVDFEVYKALTNLRETEATTYNDVLRKMIGLAPNNSVAAKISLGVRGAVYKGVNFPDGTIFRATYKGQNFTAQIRNSKWVDTTTGQTRSSPSDAASKITGTTVNGWRFWSCMRPGDAGWQLLDSLTKQRRLI